MLERFRELAGFGIEELPGAAVDADVPLPDAIVTRLAQRYMPASVPVTDLQIQALDNDELLVLIGLRLLPQMRLHLRIEQQPEPDVPILGLRWSLPKLGPLAMLAAPVLSIFKALPEGIDVEGDRIAINVARLARARGMGDLLPYLRSLRVHTRAGALVVRFTARV